MPDRAPWPRRVATAAKAIGIAPESAPAPFKVAALPKTIELLPARAPEPLRVEALPKTIELLLIRAPAPFSVAAPENEIEVDPERAPAAGDDPVGSRSLMSFGSGSGGEYRNISCAIPYGPNGYLALVSSMIKLSKNNVPTKGFPPMSEPITALMTPESASVLRVFSIPT